jgi:hypothetical protein
MNRRQFNLGLTAIMLSLSVIPKRLSANPQLDGQKSDRPATPSGAMHSSYFFKHPTFEYVFLVSLGRAYPMAGNVGKVLYLEGIAEQIRCPMLITEPVKTNNTVLTRSACAKFAAQ